MATSYRSVFHAEFCMKGGGKVFVNFKKRMQSTDPIPTSQLIQLTGQKEKPVIISYKEEGESKMTPFNSSECRINIVGGVGFTLKSLYAIDETQFMVELTGAMQWVGFILPDGCSEPFSGAAYSVSVAAVDRLAALKDMAYVNRPMEIGGLNPDGVFSTKGILYKGFSSDITTLQRALKFTGLQLNLLTAVNTYEDLMTHSESPLAQLYADNAGFANNDGQAYSCETVVVSILNRWSARLRQWNGRWEVVSAPEHARYSQVKAYVWNYDGFLNGTTFIGSTMQAGKSGTPLSVTGSTSIGRSVSKSIAYYRYGYASNKLANGDFQEWPLIYPLPEGWTKDGDINVVRMTSNEDKFDIYARLSKGSSNDQGYLRSSVVQVRAGETVEFKLDLLSRAAYQPIGNRRYIDFYFRKPDNSASFTNKGWRDGIHSYRVYRKPGEMQNQMTLSISIDERDEDYQIVVAIACVREEDGSRRFFETNINNVEARPTLSKNATGSDKLPIGQYTINESLTVHSYNPDPIQLTHCDDMSDQRTSTIRVNQNTVISLKQWRRPWDTTNLPLLTVVANNFIMMHDKPYNMADFELWGDSSNKVDPYTKLTIDDPEYTGEYLFMSGEFDVMGGNHKLRYAQHIPATLNETNLAGYGTLIEDYGDLKDKTGATVGNPGVGNPGTGIILDPSSFIRNQTEKQGGASFNVVAGTADQFNGNLNGSVYNDAAFMKFHWSGQINQPAWVWGGNAPGDAYVWRPENFRVQDAITWNSQNYSTNEQTTVPAWVMAYNPSNLHWQPTGPAAFRLFLGMPAGGETLDSVTQRGNVSLKHIIVVGGVGDGFSESTLRLDRYDRAPNLSFHYAGVVASQITISNSGEFQFKNNPGTGFTSIRAEDVSAVGTVWGQRIVSQVQGFKGLNGKGLVGDYDQVGISDKIIWTIGDAWNTPSTMYGIGYDYVAGTLGHSVFFASNGNRNTRIGLENGTFITTGRNFSNSFETNGFVSGGGGTGMSVDNQGNMEVDSLTVRKALTVTTFNIREITGTGGAFAVTNVFKIDFMSNEADRYVLYMDTQNNTIGNQLRTNDIVRCQVWDGVGVKYYSCKVFYADSNAVVLLKADFVGSGRPAVGDALFQMGNTTDVNRRGLIYMTNSDPNAPYIDVMDGLTSDSWAGSTKVRMGRLNGLTVPVWGALSGYGFYGSNIYMTNGYFDGTLTARSVNAVSIDAGSIKTGKLDADRINVDTMLVRSLKTSDTGKRVEITKDNNSVSFWSGNEGATGIPTARINTNVDGDQSFQTPGSGLSINAVGKATYATTNGLFANGSGVSFTPGSSGVISNASVVGMLFQRSGDASGISAAVVGVDGTTSGLGRYFAGYFEGGVYISGAHYSKVVDVSPSDYSVTGTDRYVMYTGNGNGGQVILPGNPIDGRVLAIRRMTSSAGIVNINGNGRNIKISSANPTSTVQIPNNTTLYFIYGGGVWYGF